MPHSRRRFLKMTGGTAALAALGLPGSVLAQGAEAGQLILAYPTDVPTWDPNARSLAPVQSLYKCVFDQPLTQAPDLAVEPALVTEYSFSDDGLSLDLTFRDDVLFHDGSKMTAEDFRYTFYERPQQPVPEGGRRLDTAFLWRKVTDIAVTSPTTCTMTFSEPMPSAVTWLYFLCSYVVPKAYLEKVGLEEFQRAPVGTGPYKVVEYQQGSRIELEAFADYWNGKPAIDRVTIEIVRDPTARVAAIESRRAGAAIDVPVREADRLGQMPGLVSTIDPIADIVLLQITKNGGFKDDAVRLAAHYAINKEAINRAFFLGNATPIDAPAARGTPGYPEDFELGYSEEKAIDLLASVGYGPANPVEITFFTTNGVFPNDYDMARAIAAMWQKVGINAKVEAVEASTYQERLRAGTLPEATMYQWGNATGDPVMYAGYLLDPNSIFAAMKSEDLGEMIHPLLVEMDADKRHAGYRAVNKFAVEHGYTIGIVQAVKTIVHEERVHVTKYDNGWILPATWSIG
ncbi:ABC transporter substrate-binding protein [Acuticoccus mangrovi]|uniref:Twin-arginine translocation signal domain-containing protein n=1 Tax=Acuticoccus mangrovi TaxID=2796142 RepID=A0A934IHM7_9HYPH|nr:ABC transporter substrate-binding protein [Acuticoccus mangrovi]MBJ3776884.1 twin-arginine translocation signal domain-containing protein [Acuticoccus mangrovi]